MVSSNEQDVNDPSCTAAQGGGAVGASCVALFTNRSRTNQAISEGEDGLR